MHTLCELDLNPAQCLFKLNVPSKCEQISTELLKGFLISCPSPHTHAQYEGKHTYTHTYTIYPTPKKGPPGYCNNVKPFL